MKVMENSIKISEGTISEFATYLHVRENAKATIQKYTSDIKAFFQYIDEDKCINKEILLQYKDCLIQKQPFIQTQKELTRKEYQKLIYAAKKDGKEQLALCMETIACTGIRISELKYFTVERIKRGKIEIYNKGKYRKIFLPKLLRENLLNYCKEHGIKTGWVFITKTGKLKDRSNLWREMKNLQKKLEWQKQKFSHII